MDKDNLRKKLANENIEGFDVALLPPKPAGNYVAVKKIGNLAYVSGQMSITSSGNVLTGINESNMIAFGYKAARIAMANTFKQLLYNKDIEEVISIIRVDGFFNTEKGNDLPKMLNGASDLISNILGEKNDTHARTVFGVSDIPYNAFLEIVVIAEIK